MKLLFVSKRSPQQRDLVERPYGRFHFLPTILASLGHEVRVLLCSHRGLPPLTLERDGVQWSSADIRSLGPREIFSQWLGEASGFRPDWIVGCSDAWYGWMAHALARRTPSARLAIDAYDNYEAYMRWNLPLHWQWRRAVHAADLVTAAGPQLAERLDGHRRGRRPTQIVPMAADPEFVSMDRAQCRAKLQLPESAPLVGYVGSWTKNRGTYLLMEAFAHIRTALPEARLVLSGRPPGEVLQEPNVIGLGYIPDADLPVLVNALDVACIVTADTAFGRYSYPAKLCEAMACRVPVVATATDAVQWMLGGRAAHLAPVGDAMAFADRTLALLSSAEANYPPRADWQSVATQWEDLLSKPPR